MSTPSFIRLSELSQKVVRAVEEAFSGKNYWVVADVTSHTYKAQSNFHYFELVDKDQQSNHVLSKFAARAWGTGSQRISVFEQATGQRFGNDIHVLVQVTVEFHPTYGLQLCVTDIDTSFTLGMLEQQRRKALQRLLQENPEHVRFEGDRYLTFNRDLKLRAVIQKLAVLSSGTSAGFQDFVHTLQHNVAGYKFSIDHYRVLVHGEHNSRQFVDRMIEVYKSGVQYDAVVIIRGGGAQTDFLLFDDYSLARAVARFPIPVITGIGHQRNQTITDLMAHTSTKTPTQAAEWIIGHNRLFMEALLVLEKRVVIKSQQLLSGHSRSLSSLNATIASAAGNYLGNQKDNLFYLNSKITGRSRTLLHQHALALQTLGLLLISAPRLVLRSRANELGMVGAELRRTSASFLKNRNSELEHTATLVRLMSPGNILKRGFAIVKQNGKITSVASDITAGDQFEVVLGGVEISAIVESTKGYDGSDFNI
ncbi:exodeoxyribonuclease VII large subunit [Arcticibacter sp. MXS-1]|uniref:exodeoxyribonuclease VII large subunit n=1 Tax=Arcticibacter sp. MXS-1 TaxID=3341726 RepID=UPI0035A83C0D